jgi:hypothetical protein
MGPGSAVHREETLHRVRDAGVRFDSVIASASEAIHLAAQGKSGLLRFARNDGKIHVRDLAAHFRASFCVEHSAF